MKHTHPHPSRTLQVRVARAFSTALLTAITTCAMAQPVGFVFQATPMARPAEPDVIALPLRVNPAEGATEQWSSLNGQRIVRNVSRPVLLPFKPAPGTANGRAVVIAPGGGYQFLSIDEEGVFVARHLAARGYHAFVLKYRTAPTASDDVAFSNQLNAGMKQMSNAAPGRGAPPLPRFEPAVEDAQNAMRLVRARADAFGVRPDRIGFIGFSAGAGTGLRLQEQAAPGTVPDQLALIYGPLSDAPVANPLPPLYALMAADDPLFAGAGFGLIEHWQRSGQRVELHLLEQGGHGFGFTPRGAPTDGWINGFLDWMSRH
jgi:acetyl esterase/lipase